MSFESIQRAMRRDRPKTPEPMRGTVPNTDQPRIIHSEYLSQTSPDVFFFLFLDFSSVI